MFFKKIKLLKLLFLCCFILLFGACSAEETQVNIEGKEHTESAETAETSGIEDPKEEVVEQTKGADENPFAKLDGKMTLTPAAGSVRTEVSFRVENLHPNQEAKLVWETVEGDYILENLYSFVGATYEPIEEEIAKVQVDGQGVWEGSFQIPEDYGGDHNVYVYQDGQKIAQANFFIETTFSISPESGTLGSEITITGEGLGWRMYGSLWHLNYNNNYMGMLTAISTKGKAEGKIRAAGYPGEQTITIESGASGFPYLNRDQSAVNYIATHYFSFDLLDGSPTQPLSYLEEVPPAANGGIIMPDLQFAEGVEITLSSEQGFVGEEVTMNGKGLPANTELDIIWNTMVGSRVSSAGFWEESSLMKKVSTNEKGEFSWNFPIPDDLGGPPHRIDIQVDEKIFGQAYLRILPQIVSVTPASGPAGTPFNVLIKGAGWTEYDNAYHVTYDNSYLGYICGFNSQGTINLPLVASGEAGLHLIDIYPGIYKGQQLMPDIYLRPQLTYEKDHPGTGIPAMRTAFEVIK